MLFTNFLKKIYDIVKKNKLTVLGSYFHRFSNNSFMGIVALSESHISVHTWPELGIVNLDVCVCNYKKDNAPNARRIFGEISTLFLPGKITRKEIKR